MSGRKSVVPSARRSAGHSPSAGSPSPQRLRDAGLVEGQPLVEDLVAREEPLQVVAGRIPAVPHHHDLRLRRLGGDPLQAAEALGGELADPGLELGRGGGQRVVLPRLHAQHAAGLERPRRRLHLGAEDHRHLAIDRPRRAGADDPLRPVHRLRKLDPPRDHHEERAGVALVHQELALREMDVRRRAGDPRQLGLQAAGRRAERSRDRRRSAWGGFPRKVATSDTAARPRGKCKSPGCNAA